MSVVLCQSSWNGCCETVTEGRSLFVVVYLSLSIGHFVSVGSVAVDHFGLVAVGWSLWDGRYGKIASV